MDRGLERVALVVSAALPVVAALAHASLVDDGAHDASLIRTLGLASSGGPSLASLEALLAAPFLVLPIGTLVFRLALVSVVAAGAGGVALYVLARSTAARVFGSDARVPRLAMAVGLVASLTATLGRGWQLESSVPLSHTIVTACVLATLAGFTRTNPSSEPSMALPPWVAVRRIVLSGLLAVAAALVFRSIRLARGAVNFPEMASAVEPTKLLFERSRVVTFLVHEVGTVTTIVAAAGVLLALIERRSRYWAIGLSASLAIALTCVGFGSDAGPERFSSPTLLSLALVQVFAGAGVARLVRWVADLRVPLARASAAMVALLAAAFPAMAFDETSLAREARAFVEMVSWSPAALGNFRAGTLIVGEDPRAFHRLVAASLSREAPPGLAFVPLYDLGGRMVRQELVRTPALVPLVRDMTLTGAPTELALSKLAAEREVVLFFSARWERALARHLVPDGVLDRFEPEPRGGSERQRGVALSEEALTPLARLYGGGVARTLATSTAELLRARVGALASIGERELAFRVLEQMRVFSPSDPFVASMETRLRAKGSVELRDLARR